MSLVLRILFAAVFILHRQSLAEAVIRPGPPRLIVKDVPTMVALVRWLTIIALLRNAPMPRCGVAALNSSTTSGPFPKIVEDETYSSEVGETCRENGLLVSAEEDFLMSFTV